MFFFNFLIFSYLTSELLSPNCMPIWEETSGQTQDTLERLYLLAGLGTSLCPPGGVGGCSWGEGSVWMSLLKLLPPRPGPL